MSKTSGYRHDIFFAFHDAPIAMLFAVFESRMTLLVQAAIFAPLVGESMDSVCPTRHFGKQTLDSIGSNQPHPPRK